MADTALHAIPIARTDELESPARRALRRLFQRKGAVAGIVVIVTFILLKIVGVFVPLRYTDEELELGDVAVHDEEVYPDERVLERIGTRSGALASVAEGTNIRAAGGAGGGGGPDVALPPTGMTASTDETTWEGGAR